VISEMSRLF